MGAEDAVRVDELATARSERISFGGGSVALQDERPIDHRERKKSFQRHLHRSLQAQPAGAFGRAAGSFAGRELARKIAGAASEEWKFCAEPIRGEPRQSGQT